MSSKRKKEEKESGGVNWFALGAALTELGVIVGRPVYVSVDRFESVIRFRCYHRGDPHTVCVSTLQLDSVRSDAREALLRSVADRLVRSISSR